MFLASQAYLSEFMDSFIFLVAGDTHAIIVVLELPPRESFKILVNFESLKGM
jgi:hypothetical protein